MEKTQKSVINIFQRYLTIWVALCMVAGVLIGKLLPQIPDFLDRFECPYLNTNGNTHLADDLSDDDEGGFSEHQEYRQESERSVCHMGSELADKPFSMYGIASLFFMVIFKTFITPELATEYLAGAALLGAALWYLSGVR